MPNWIAAELREIEVYYIDEISDLLDTKANYPENTTTYHHGYEFVAAFEAILKLRGWKYEPGYKYPDNATQYRQWAYTFYLQYGYGEPTVDIDVELIKVKANNANVVNKWLYGAPHNNDYNIAGNAILNHRVSKME